MNLEIEQQGLNRYLNLPQRTLRTPFQMTVSQTLIHETEAGSWGQLTSGEATAIPLRLSNWRGVLLSLQRDWNYWRDPKNHAGIFNTGSDAGKEFDLSPLTFSYDGVVYEDPEKLPAPPDVACALGTFVLATPTLLVTDPCYGKGTWCTGELEARTGEWAALVIKRDDYRGHRNAVLLVAHTSVDIRSIVLEELEDAQLTAGVDSGQAGFFEKARYPDDKTQLEYEKGTWYHAVAELTLNDEGGNASIAPGRFGAVSQTFWGDGGYPCLVKKDDAGLVVAAALIFDGSLGSEDDEDDEGNEQATGMPRPAPIYVDDLIPDDYSVLERLPSGTSDADAGDDNDDDVIIITRRTDD
jgi:hypothetical protein